MMVFFFKQKTAYELRISDWSSDVCSSDLEGLTAFLNYAYTDAKYTRYPGTTIDSAGNVRRNIDSPYVGAPKHQLTMGARFVLPLDESIGEVVLSGDYYLQSSIWLDDSALQRSEEHTSEIQSLMRHSYAAFCWKK